MKPLVSVIIPVYNTKFYLKEAIDSVIDQKEFIHEIILIDDGSTDGSGELLEELYSKIPYIKILHTKNQRQGPARNLGTSISTGNFIYYFDSDDLVSPGLFKAFHDTISSHPNLDIFCFSCLPFVDPNYQTDSETRKLLESTEYYLRKISALCKTGEEAFNLLYPLKSFSPLPYLYLFRKSVITNNKIGFRSIRLEDEEFVFQLFLHAGETLISNDVYCKRRMREGSTMQLNRCFADMFGYMKTIETLEKLRQIEHLKPETKINLLNKIQVLVKAIIFMKVSSNIKLNSEEKMIYKTSLAPYVNNNLRLFFYYHTYAFEYKLRMLKQNLFRYRSFYYKSLR
ncbi:MAG: glycosyltransferase [Ignavibacteriaceae bacterium]|nr:glycosyltransferase [Ignavibacteriaceae bacterium]